MNRQKKIALVVALCLLFLGAVLYLLPGRAKEAPVIRVGSKDFTESLIVGELYALALENAGYRVKRVFNIAGSVVHTSLVNNEIDLYPEYTGTGLLVVLKMAPMNDPAQVYDTVKREYAKRFKLTWLDQSRANDSQGLVIKTQVAKALGIATLSDLQKNADKIRFASQGEFDQRDDGLPAMVKAYGPFNWKSSRVYDNGLKYQVLLNGEADLSPAYTTEGQLVNTAEFTLIEDDKHIWPPYFLAPVARDNALASHPDIAAALNAVSASLDTRTITGLNAKVDVDKREVDDVAKEFFTALRRGTAGGAR